MYGSILKCYDVCRPPPGIVCTGIDKQAYAQFVKVQQYLCDVFAAYGAVIPLCNMLQLQWQVHSTWYTPATKFITIQNADKSRRITTLKYAFTFVFTHKTAPKLNATLKPMHCSIL